MEEKEIFRGYTILIDPVTQNPEDRALMSIEADSASEAL